MDIYELIRGAILGKKQVVATYREYERELCPHVLGRKNGRAQALFYQFAGGSSSGLPPEGEWRCLPLEGLTNVSVREGEWHSGTSHTRPQTCVGDVDVVADY